MKLMTPAAADKTSFRVFAELLQFIMKCGASSENRVSLPSSTLLPCPRHSPPQYPILSHFSCNCVSWGPQVPLSALATQTSLLLPPSPAPPQTHPDQPLPPSRPTQDPPHSLGWVTLSVNGADSALASILSISLVFICGLSILARCYIRLSLDLLSLSASIQEAFCGQRLCPVYLRNART